MNNDVCGMKSAYKQLSPSRLTRGAALQWEPFALIAALVILWQAVAASGLVPAYMLPSPVQVVRAFVRDFPLLCRHALATLGEAGEGLALAILAAFVFAIAMDSLPPLGRALTPLLTLTQTMPTIAVAPLLVLWLGYGAAPKVALVFITCFFPMTFALLGAFADDTRRDECLLLRSLGANRAQLYYYIKLPASLAAFFPALKVSASYAIIGAVVAEWLGGDRGLGVYMTRVRKTYSFDRMFAVILLTAALSLLLVKAIDVLEKKCMPWIEDRE